MTLTDMVNTSNTPEDMLSNEILLLYLIRRINEQNNFLGITKLQKFVYLIESAFYIDDTKSLKYPFFRWNFGPMSKEVYNECRKLAENNLIEKTGHEIKHIKVTKRGEDVLLQCSDFFDSNKQILQIVDELVDKYSHHNTNELKNIVYNIKDPSLDIKIKDVPQASDLLVGLFDKEDTVNIDVGWRETLDILLDKGAYDSFIDSISDAQLNKSIRCEELFCV